MGVANKCYGANILLILLLSWSMVACFMIIVCKT
jgi:hypothetical protein